MAAVHLLTATPRDPSTGEVATVRLAGGGRGGYTHLGSTAWRAGLSRPPAIAQRLGFEDGRWGGPSIAQAVELRWGGTRESAAALAGLYWRDAPFELRTGPEDGADGDFTLLLSGRVAEAATEPGTLILQMADPTLALAKPVVSGTFAGTGGIEGPAELKGKPKRRAWGACYNVELWSLDPAYNIWVATDPARPLQGLDTVRDRGNPASELTIVGWAGSIGATLDALRVAAAPPGGAVVAPSIAALKWWYPNPGKLTVDLRGEIGTGYVDRPADIAAQIVGAVSGPTIDADQLVAARNLRNVSAGWLISSSTDTAAASIEALLGGVSLWWGLSAAGVVEIGPWSWGSPVATLAASRVDRVRSHAPVSKLVLGWRPNWTPMSRGDIAASVLGGDVAWGDGTPLDELKPAEPGATNSADPDSAIGDRTVRVVIQDLDRVNADLESALPAIDLNAVSVFSLLKTVTAMNAFLAARATLEGKPVGTVVVEVREVTESTVETISLIGAKNGDGTAFVLNGSTVMVTPTQSLAQKFSSVDATTGLLSSAVIQLDQAITTETSARATAITQVTATLGADLSAAVFTLNESIVDEAGARATAITQVTANYTAAINAASQTINTAMADADSALASQISTVTATANGLTAQVGFLMSAVVDTSGSVTAKAVLALKANGHLAGIVATNNGTMSQLDLDFDVVRIFKPDGTLLFQASGSTVYMPNVIVDTLQVNTAVVPVRARATSPMVGIGDTEGDWRGVLSVTVNLPKLGSIDISAGANQGFSGGVSAGQWGFRIVVYNSGIPGGARVLPFQPGGTYPGDNISLPEGDSNLIGTTHVELQHKSAPDVTLNERFLKVSGFPNTN